MSGYDMLSVVLIVLVVIDWAATRILVAGALRLKYRALEERAGVSAMLSIMASGVALLALLYLLDVPAPPILSTLVIIGVFLGISLPQVVWVVAYVRGKFDE